MLMRLHQEHVFKWFKRLTDSRN